MIKMSRGSSIHIEKASPGIFLHNTRQKSNVKNSIFDQSNNEYLRDGQKALLIYRAEIEGRIHKYQNRMHRRLPKTTVLLFDAVVNLEKHHKLADVKKLARYLEETLGTKVINITIHRDEGWVDSDGQKHINHHAHITFLGLDTEGRSIRKKMTRKFLIQLQDDTAKILKMDRGHNIGRKHISSRDYKYIMNVLRQEKQKIIQRYQKHRNYFESYQKFFEKYDDIVQKVKTGQMDIDTAKAIMQDVAGMYDRGILEKLNIVQLSRIAQIGAIALAQMRADIRTQNTIVREIEKQQNMSLSMVERTISDILRFVKKMHKVHNIQIQQQHKGGIEI